jgi:tetratricopeptide (TPR) repeat protein
MFAMKTMTATRLDVARYYAAAFEAQSDGKLEETIKNLEAAIALDPNTSGLGYQGLAVIARNLDKVDEAKQYIKQALSHLGGMTTRERLATRGVNAIIEGSPESCVQEYGVLLSTYSADAMSRNQRGLCLSKLRKMREAVGEMQQAVKLLPKRPLFRANLALYAAYGGDFQTAQQQALEIKEPYDYATLAVAFAQLGRGSLTEAAQTYEKLAGVSLRGASWSALGLGDIELYRGRYTEAIRILEKGAAADLKTEFPERAARKQISIGYAHFLRGETTQAIAAADKALRTSTSAEVQFLAARVLIEAGETTRAQPIADALATQFPSEPHTYGKILQGEIALKTGDARRAIALLTEANDQSKGGLDTWLGHFALGRAYLAVEQYVDADSQFDQCLQRKGEALALLVDESPTFGYFPMVYYYQGQVREALKTSGYAAAYREYLKIRGDSTEDRLVPEVRRRAG